jgi:succinyl-diaminopimelate desuccinylase
MLSKAEEDGFDIFDADGWGGHIEWPGAYLDERGEIYAAANETLGVAVHLDVVPAGEGWAHDPWGGETVDGRIYGRGTTDNKNAVAAVYYAMKSLKDAGYTPAKNIRLILGLDEETGFTEMHNYFEKTDMPDIGFAPDTEFPVINGEKGILIFEIAKKLEAGNESGLILRSVKGGNAPNMVPDHCRAILTFEDMPGSAGAGARKRSAASAASANKGKEKSNAKETKARDNAFALVKEMAEGFRARTGTKLSYRGTGSSLEIIASGISAHGAQPEKGVNAISILMDFLSGLPIANESARDFVEFYQSRIGNETDGRSLGIALEDRLSGSLILNAGMIDLNREAAVLTINVRYPISKRDDDVYGALRPALDENGLGVVKISGLPSLYYAPDDPLVETLMEVYRENTGDAEIGPVIIGGGTYARALPKAVAFGPRFPDEEEVMHQKDEYVSIDSLMKAAHIYADAIYRLGFR